MSSSRHAWVDYSKGICILGVVTLYAVTKMHEELGVEGWLGYWADFARPFRMPDFFLLSGLFLGRVVDRPWREYLDKKVLHYLYFFVLWSAIYFLSKLAIGRAGATPSAMLLDFATSLVQPFAMLWFIAMLPMFFVVTRLTRRVPAWLMVPAAAALQAWPLASDWMMVGHFCERYLWFYLGYRFAPMFFAIAEGARRHPRAAVTGLVGWAVANQALISADLAFELGLKVVTGLAGCIAVIVTGSLLTGRRQTEWLRYLGEHSIVTYLAFFLPMGALIVAMRRYGLPADPGTMAALLSVVSVLFAHALHAVARRGRLAFLFERPAWARLALRRPMAARPRGEPA